MISADTNLWEDLLLAIEEGQVVPIVGRDLLVVETETGPQFFHRVIAQRLAEDLRVEPGKLPPEFDANDVICAYEGFHGDPVGMNNRVARILKALKVAVPEPLRLLAEIPAFRIFVSTTFDTLLEDAITAARGRAPTSVAFPPVASNLTDFDDTMLEDEGRVVFHILGRVSASASFAVTEGQTLELMHELIAGDRRAEKLKARLRESHLLVLGVNFPDWLARMLLRLARAKPLWDSRPMMEVIADGGRTQPELAVFLRHFSPQQSRLYTGGSPVDFVRELHRRWFERHPVEARVEEPEEEANKPDEMARGSIFISYAGLDRAAAFRLADELNAAGLETWVDRRLNPGDRYRHIIERYIRHCGAFVAVLSAHVQADDERWFRREWEQACDRDGKLFGTPRSILFPVIVDSTPTTEITALEEVFRRTAIRAPGGAAPPALVQQLDQAQKAWRKQFARA